MVDLHWAEPEAKRHVTCSTCSKMQKSQRKCESEGYNHNKGRGYRVDDYGIRLSFCPGKATWSAGIAELFLQCKQAYLVGEYPKKGRLEDQNAIFSVAYPTFVERWEERKFYRGWQMFNKIGPEYAKHLIKGFQAPWTS